MRAILLLGLLAVGCGGASSRISVAPDGRWCYQVACRDWVDCRLEAGRLCPKGYKPLGTGERTTGAVAQSFGNMTYARPVVVTIMDIRCLEALGGAPTD